jgi:glycosyltransferase involved in cell wall biosynthesis
MEQQKARQPSLSERFKTILDGKSKLVQSDGDGSRSEPLILRYSGTNNPLMKIGLLITTYNRPQYLQQCLNSLYSSDLTSVHQILIVDDASSDPKVKPLLEKAIDILKAKVWVNQNNKGIANNIGLGSELLFETFDCDSVINLDPDTIVSHDWINKLSDLHKRFKTVIASGFNTLSRHPGVPKPRHDVHEWFPDYVTKNSIGGINMMYSFSVFNKIIKPHLVAENWDWRVCDEFKKRYWLFVVTRPSVVQHIGIGEGMHPSNNPDVAFDYE